MTFSTAKRSASVSRAMRITGALFPVLLSLFARGAFGAHGVFLRVRVAQVGTMQKNSSGMSASFLYSWTRPPGTRVQ